MAAEVSGTCDDLVVWAPAQLAPPWERAVSELRARIARLPPGQCAPMILEVEATNGGYVLHARAPDGREARRTIEAAEDVEPIAMGLLAGLPGSAAVRARRPPAQAAAAQDPHELPPVGPQATTPAMQAIPSRLPTLTLGAAVGARGAIPTDAAMVDIALRADARFRDWLAYAAVRTAQLAATGGLAVDNDSYAETVAGVGAGTALRWGRASVDVTVAASVAFVSQEVDAPTEHQGSLVQLRFGAGALYAYPMGRSWSFTVSLDTEVSPRAVRQATEQANLPPYPALSLGLSVGARVGIL